MQHTITLRDGVRTVELRTTENGGVEFTATIRYDRDGTRRVNYSRTRRGDTTVLRTEAVLKHQVRGRWTRAAFEADVAFDLGQYAAQFAAGPALVKASDLAIAAQALVKGIDYAVDQGERAALTDVVRAKLVAVRS